MNSPQGVTEEDGAQIRGGWGPEDGVPMILLPVSAGVGPHLLVCSTGLPNEHSPSCSLGRELW